MSLNRTKVLLEKHRVLLKEGIIFGVLFSKDHGTILCTSPHGPLERLFKQLKSDVRLLLLPLIEKIREKYEIEAESYGKMGGLFSNLPSNHTANKLLTLLNILCCDQKFFGKYKAPLSKCAIPSTDVYSPTIDTLTETLVAVTGCTTKEAYKLLLKINACKEKYHFVDSCFVLQDSNECHRGMVSDACYKSGVEELQNITEFKKKIEKSIVYLMHLCNQTNSIKNNI